MTEEGRSEPGGSDDRLLAWPRVQDITGLSRTTAWRLQRAGSFPSPVRISVNRVAWRESELTAWSAARTREAPPSVAARALAPARAPKLPGLNRSRSPVRAAVRTVDPVASLRPDSGSEQVGASVKAKGSKRRPKATASLDQIDFGF
ncbi:helix-turn-helix transcriptional regulator [Brevundimonas mediterranea]|uniref:helix-turn-helix transcriptional regulator n=1 Tax=Brevundimonas mediterranea TaxID=74329 RepID=UPI0012B680D0|nr:AlpA family phage regulatory protein [Brevundimonas mediterranea]